MNDTLKVLETRRSCRNFDPAKPVSDEAVQAIVKAGTYAPTGRGIQSPIIIAVSNKELRDEISAENARIMGVCFRPNSRIRFLSAMKKYDDSNVKMVEINAFGKFFAIFPA